MRQVFGMRCWARVGAFALVGWVVAGIAAPLPCEARSRGISAKGCNGCHNGGAEPQARITALSEAVPGQPLTLLLEIEAKNGPTAGFYLTAEGGGTLSAVAGQGTQMLGEGIAHSSPKDGSGFVRFEINWNAPADPTGVLLSVWAVSANDNNTSGGDGATFTTFSLVSGCEGALYFRDADRDGYGSASFGTRMDCEQREGYSLIEGDCDENNAEINPSADEYCNERDDDCDDLVDEGSMPQAHYPDEDGDGHGVRGGESVLECPPPAGYAPNKDDCYDGDATVYLDAPELCDGLDNDCDNSADERVKPTCGVGWCRRESSSCSEAGCEPGEPRAEECNAFDDDCDDVLDEGVDCGAGLICEAGYCIEASTTAGQGSTVAGQGSMPVGGAGASGTGGAPSVKDNDAGTATPSSHAAGCNAVRLRSLGIEPLAICAGALWFLFRRRNQKQLFPIAVVKRSKR